MLRYVRIMRMHCSVLRAVDARWRQQGRVIKGTEKRSVAWGGEWEEDRDRTRPGGEAERRSF